MVQRIEATFSTATWKEDTVDPLGSPNTTQEGSTDCADTKPAFSSLDPALKFTQARVEFSFTNGLVGKALVLYTMVHHIDPDHVPTTTTTTNEECGPDSKHCRPPGSMATYTGLLYFKGCLVTNLGEEATEEGEATFIDQGVWGKGGKMVVVGNWTLVPGSTTGSLKEAFKAGVKGGYESSGSKDTKCWFEVGA